MVKTPTLAFDFCRGIWIDVYVDRGLGVSKKSNLQNYFARWKNIIDEVPIKRWDFYVHQFLKILALFGIVITKVCCRKRNFTHL